MSNSKPTFVKWPKIGREDLLQVTITEKINGTNVCVIVLDGKVVGAQSRNRLLSIKEDHYEFAQWVEDNKQDLSVFPDGYHYGEWAGPGIQDNPLNLNSRKFFLFNQGREWLYTDPFTFPGCVRLLPILYRGHLHDYTIDTLLAVQAEDNAYDGKRREGIVIHYPAIGRMTKHTHKAKRSK